MAQCRPGVVRGPMRAGKSRNDLRRTPPSWLTDTAAAIYRRLVASPSVMAVTTEADSIMLALLAEALSVVKFAQSAIAKEGVTVTGADGVR